MTNIKETERVKCHVIIHTTSIASGVTGAGLCWLPGSDAPIISAGQIAMAISLGKVFGIELSQSAAKAAVAAAAASTAGRAASQLASFWIPIANVVINSGTAIGITEFVGWTLAEEFAKQAAS